VLRIWRPRHTGIGARAPPVPYLRSGPKLGPSWGRLCPSDADNRGQPLPLTPAFTRENRLTACGPSRI
jgi:hypothetical protein